MPALRPNVPPPPHYYANNLLRLVRTVANQYSDLLQDREREYIERVSTLSDDALRLYARLLTRKGPLIRIDSIGYREIGDLSGALTELEAKSLLQRRPPLPADRALETLTRAELDTVFPYARSPGARKHTQITVIAARYPDHRIRKRVDAVCPACAVLDLDILATLQILFFGDTRTDLSAFVLEDLGMLRFEPYRLDPIHRQFNGRAELDDYLVMRDAKALLRALEGRWQRETAMRLLESLWPERPGRLLERVRSGLVNRLGRCAERARDYDVALSAYGRTLRAPSRERRARVLRRLGDVDGELLLLDAIDRGPVCAAERHFAQTFRPAGRPGRGLAQRIPERVLRLPGTPAVNVEAAALAALTCSGGYGRHLENALPLGMLGLAFWDVVFAPIDAAFINPYQDRPADLYWDDFRHARATLIESRFEALRDPRAFAKELGETLRVKRGTSNALVDWRAFDEPLLDRVIASVPCSMWLRLFDYMLDDLEQTRTGFPDLALFAGRGVYRFVEVKGPGDQLRREQRLWFEFFRRADIPAFVLHVEW